MLPTGDNRQKMIKKRQQVYSSGFNQAVFQFVFTLLSAIMY